MKKNIAVAIVGGGPAGAALATHLRRAGHVVAIFDNGRRPPLVVGESLVPALTPLINELGIEEQVAAVSTYKPGATFYTTPTQEVSFFFSNAGRRTPTYAYNVPRAEFDAIVLNNAIASGALILQKTAKFAAPFENSNDISFDADTLAAWHEATGCERPDLIVDASGRHRTIAKLLGLSSWEGGRKDAALFAHLQHPSLPHEGHIHINRLKRGWSWRIPLPDCVSVGVVISRDSLAAYGDTAEEQYDRLCAEEPILRSYAAHAKRVTPVMKYTNYQLASERWVGPSWALLGDAGGFIDPIFSSGLLLALEGAKELATAINAGWATNATHYQRVMTHKLSAWRGLIEAFYDGRIFSLFRLREMYKDSWLFSLLVRTVDQQLALALSGVAPTSKRRLWLLHTLLHRLGASRFPARVRIS